MSIFLLNFASDCIKKPIYIGTGKDFTIITLKQ